MRKINGLFEIANYIPLISLFFLIAIIFIWILFLWPRFEDYRYSKEELSKIQKTVSQKQEYVANLKEVKQKLEDHSAEVLKIESSLPESADMPSLFNYLQNTASYSGVLLGKLGSYNIQESKDYEGLREVSFSISAQGSYPSLIGFVSALEKSARMIEIENVSLSGGEENEFTFNLELKTFNY